MLEFGLDGLLVLGFEVDVVEIDLAADDAVFDFSERDCAESVGLLLFAL